MHIFYTLIKAQNEVNRINSIKPKQVNIGIEEINEEIFMEDTEIDQLKEIEMYQSTSL